MVRVPITIELPEDAAEEARKEGLLTDTGVSALVMEELARRQKVDALQAFFGKVDQLRAVSESLSDEEVQALVQAEIDAARADS